jgi:HK97 family phage portal protein
MGYTDIRQGVITRTRERVNGWANYPADHDYWYMRRSPDTDAGIQVDESTALTNPTFWACVRVIAESLSTLPVGVYDRVDENTRMPVDHWLNELLTSRANKDATGITVRESGGLNKLVWGGSFQAIDWNNRMTEPRRLTPLQARYFDPIKRDDEGELIFMYREPGAKPERIPNDRMWYTPGLSLDGVTGMSVVAYHRNTIALGLAARQYRSSLFGNNCQLGGTIEQGEGRPALSQTAEDRLMDQIREKHQGSGQAFRWMYLREGMKANQFAMPTDDAMFLEMERPNRIAMCGIFRVPPVFVGDDDRATYHNTEQQALEFVTFCMLPWVVRVEMSAKRRFFPESTLYVRHNMAGLVRGDLKTRMEAYNIGLPLGLWSIDEVRALEEMNPLPGGLGDTRYRPLNMGILGQEAIQQVGGEKALAVMGQLSHQMREGFAEQRVDRIGHQVRCEQLIQQGMEASRQQAQLMSEAVHSVDRSLAELQQTTVEVGDRQTTAADKRSTEQTTQIIRQITVQSDRQATASERIATQVTDLSTRLVAPVIDTFLPMIKASAERIGDKEEKAVIAAFRKHADKGTADGFREWAEKFYAGHAAWIAGIFEPIFRGYEQAARQAVRPTAAEVAKVFCNATLAALLVTVDQPVTTGGLLDKWGETVAGKLAVRVSEVLSDKETV